MKFEVKVFPPFKNNILYRWVPEDSVTISNMQVEFDSTEPKKIRMEAVYPHVGEAKHREHRIFNFGELIHLNLNDQFIVKLMDHPGGITSAIVEFEVHEKVPEIKGKSTEKVDKK